MKTDTILAATMYRGTITQISVSVTVSDGIGIHLVGLQDAPVKELLLRVVTAMQSCGYGIPGKKIVVQFCELGRAAGLSTEVARRREALSALDLAVALQLLISTGQVPALPRTCERLFIGELGLDGSIRPPYMGFGSPDDAAAVLDHQLHYGFGAVAGWRTWAGGLSVWKEFGNLADIIEAIKSNNL